MITQPSVVEDEGGDVMVEDEASVVVVVSEELSSVDIEVAVENESMDKADEGSVDNGEALMEVIEAKKLP